MKYFSFTALPIAEPDENYNTIELLKIGLPHDEIYGTPDKIFTSLFNKKNVNKQFTYRCTIKHYDLGYTFFVYHPYLYDSVIEISRNVPSRYSVITLTEGLEYVLDRTLFSLNNNIEKLLDLPVFF